MTTWLVELWDFIVDLFDRGNRWGRVAIGAILILITLPIVLSVFGLNDGVAVAGLIPFIAVIAVILMFPVIVAAIAVTGRGRRALMPALGLLGMIGLEYIYFYLIPVDAAPHLVVPLVLIVLTMITIGVSARGRFRTYTLRALGIVFLILTTIFFIRGWGLGGFSWTRPASPTEGLSARAMFVQRAAREEFSLEPGAVVDKEVDYRNWALDGSPGGATYITGLDEYGRATFPRHIVGSDRRDARNTLPKCHILRVEAAGMHKQYTLWREPEHG